MPPNIVPRPRRFSLVVRKGARQALWKATPGSPNLAVVLFQFVYKVGQAGHRPRRDLFQSVKGFLIETRSDIAPQHGRHKYLSVATHSPL
jgi:hypothetical protein